jgi:hypothetical protein
MTSPASGSYFQMSGLAPTPVDAYGFPVDLRLKPNSTQAFGVRSASLFVEKMNG